MERGERIRSVNPIITCLQQEKHLSDSAPYEAG